VVGELPGRLYYVGFIVVSDVTSFLCGPTAYYVVEIGYVY
jgi:hypothetical protein